MALVWLADQTFIILQCVQPRTYGVLPKQDGDVEAGVAGGPAGLWQRGGRAAPAGRTGARRWMPHACARPMCLTPCRRTPDNAQPMELVMSYGVA